MRAFFCIELEANLKDQLSRILSRLKRSDVRVTWVRLENLHITLKFLGEVDDAIIPQLELTAADAVRDSEIINEIKCKFDQIGAFPHLNRPRVIWVGCKAEPEKLQLLTKQLEERLSPLGFEKERGPFVTHITLGRVKEEGSKVARLSELIQKTEPFSFATSLAGITLMKSELTHSGSIYTPLFTKRFSGK